jgi:hypothetical protein
MREEIFDDFVITRERLRRRRVLTAKEVEFRFFFSFSSHVRAWSTVSTLLALLSFAHHYFALLSIIWPGAVATYVYHAVFGNPGHVACFFDVNYHKWD